ncbi:MAG TPA: DUF4124 domain-containing protein [Gammaproteobacteria bacterium]|jgi:hypothetical protein
MRVLSLLLLCACMAAVSADPLYKWVDADGHVHYSQTPPPGAATKAKTMEVHAGQADPAAVQASQQLAQQQMADQQQADEKAQQQAQKDSQHQEAVQQACDRLRVRLQIYQQAGPVFTVDAQGNRHYVSDADHLKEEQELQDQIKKYCSGSH